MKRFIWGLIAGLFLLGCYFPLYAADLKTPPAYKAPVAGVPGYDYWNGVYVGLEGGVGWDRGAGTASDPFGSMGFETAPFGFVAGVLAGYNIRAGTNFVVGIEGNADLVTADGTITNPGFIGSINSKSRALASIRGRIGYLLAPNLLAYVTGGWGWAWSEFTVTGTDGSQFSTSPTLGGGVAGGGLEYALTPNLGLRVQYLLYFLGDANMSTTGSVNGGPIIPIGASITHSMGTATAGVAFHF